MLLTIAVTQRNLTKVPDTQRKLQRYRKYIRLENSCVGSPFDEWTRLRAAEFSLTCRIQSLCPHEINQIEHLQGAAMRLEFALYATEILYTRFATEYTSYKESKDRDIIAGNSTTELLNQVYLRRKPKREKLHQFKQKAMEQFGSQITTLTIIYQPNLRGTRT